MTRTVASNDEMFLKYAKLEMVVDGLNATFIQILMLLLQLFCMKQMMAMK
jgi:hypothetical protein